MKSRINARTIALAAIVIVILMFRPGCGPEGGADFPAQATSAESEADINLGNPAQNRP